MKKKYLHIIILSFLTLNVVWADQQKNVTTPAGNSVEAWILDEMSDSERASFDKSISLNYPKAYTIKNGVYSSTKTYNCHGYAWHMTEGGDARWIGNGSTAHEDIYMSEDDGSYVEVLAGANPRKVSYASDDHSAVTTDQSNWFISKWGQGPLMRHAYNDCPYSSASLRYFIRRSLFQLNGEVSICNGSTTVYSINYQPKNPIVWSVTSGLEIVSGQGTAHVSIRSTTPNKIQGAVSVKFGKFSMIKIVSLNGVDVTSITGSDRVKLNTTQTYNANASYSFNDMDWRWELATSVYPAPSYTTTSSSLTVTFAKEGSYTLRCWVETPCRVSTGTGYLYVMVGPYYSVQLDPQTGLLKIMRNENHPVESKAKTLCSYELIGTNGLVASNGMFDSENGLLTYIDNLSKGVYILKITDINRQSETHKLLY